MRVEVEYKAAEEVKPKTMTPAAFSLISVIFALTIVGLYLTVDAARTQPIDMSKADQFSQSSRRFPVNAKGQEIPFKFMSGTEKQKGTEFVASIFIKFPPDLVDNTTFVGRIIELVETEIEDAIDKFTDGKSYVIAEFKQPARKIDKQIIEAIFLVEYIEGTSDFLHFLIPIVKQFDDSVTYYNDLLQQFYQYGLFYKEADYDREDFFNYDVEVPKPQEPQDKDDGEIEMRMSLIDRLRK